MSYLYEENLDLIDEEDGPSLDSEDAVMALPTNTNTYVPQDSAGWTCQVPSVFTPVDNGIVPDVNGVVLKKQLDFQNTASNWTAQTQVLNDKA